MYTYLLFSILTNQHKLALLIRHYLGCQENKKYTISMILLYLKKVLRFFFVTSYLPGSTMSVLLIILMLSVAVTEGYNCVGPVPADEKNVICIHKGFTTIPILPAEVEVV